MHMSAIAQWFHLFLVVIKPISAGKKIISRLDVNDPFKCEHIGQMSLPVNCIRGSLLKTPGLGRLTNSFWNECCLEHCPPLLTYQVFPHPAAYLSLETTLGYGTPTIQTKEPARCHCFP